MAQISTQRSSARQSFYCGLNGGTLDVEHLQFDPNLIHCSTTVLVTSNIQQALVKVPILNSLQALAIMVDLNGLKAVYQSPTKHLVQDDFDMHIGFS